MNRQFRQVRQSLLKRQEKPLANRPVGKVKSISTGLLLFAFVMTTLHHSPISTLEYGLLLEDLTIMPNRVEPPFVAFQEMLFEPVPEAWEVMPVSEKLVAGSLSQEKVILEEMLITTKNEEVPEPQKLFHTKEAQVLAEKFPVVRAAGNAIHLSGRIELAGGIALIDEKLLEIKRISNGEVKEVARVDLKDSRFDFHFGETSGIILGQVFDEKGQVIGQGSLSMETALNANEPSLILRPYHASQAKLDSVYGTTQKKNKIDASARVRIEGTDEIIPIASNGKLQLGQFSEDSQILTSAEAKGFAPHFSVYMVQNAADLMLLPEKMVKGLSDILADQGIPLNLNKGDALIWGQVLQDSHPMNDASVVVANDANSAIYMGGLYLPDPIREKTSENGLFAIPIHQPGWQEIIVSIPGGSGIHINVFTQPGQVTQVAATIPIENKRLVLRSFDAFTGEVVGSVRASFQQLDEGTETNSEGTAKVDLASLVNLTYVDLTPSRAYLEQRVMYSKVGEELYMPMIKQDWLEGIKAQLRINEVPGSHVIVGFVQGDEFELLPLAQAQNRENLAYFNASGLITRSAVGPMGGGFILFNQIGMPIQVAVTGKKDSRRIQKIVIPKEGNIPTLNFSF